jgi:hypothetical protein
VEHADWRRVTVWSQLDSQESRPEPDEWHIAANLSIPRPLSLPALRVLQPRKEIDAIVDAINLGRNYVIVEGVLGSGTSTSVAVARSVLSQTRATVQAKWLLTDTADSFLRRLLGIAHGTKMEMFVKGLTENGRCEDVIAALKRRPRTTHPPPLLIVEAAEEVPSTTLRGLLGLAKEFADARLGQFLFVFSTSEQLPSLRGLDALSRASIIPIRNLAHEATLNLLEAANKCTRQQAEFI